MCFTLSIIVFLPFSLVFPMRDYHMANSKPYASFVLLFAFLLTHNIVQSINGNYYDLMPPWYNGAADYHPSNMNDIGIHDNDYGPPPPIYADAVDYHPLDVKHIGIHDKDLVVPPPWYNGVVDYYQPSNVKDIGVHRHVQKLLPSKIEPPSDEENFHHNHFIEIQRSPIKPARLEHERDHHTDAIDYQLLGLQDTAIPPEWLPPRSAPTKDEIIHNHHLIDSQRPLSSSITSPRLESERDHHTHVIDHQLSALNCIEGKNYKEGTEMMSYRRMMRPHKENNDLRSFQASPVKI